MPKTLNEFSLRRRVHDILELGLGHDPFSNLVNISLIFLIVLNVIAFAAATVTDLNAAYGIWFERFNLFSVIVFSIEYAARIWSCIELPFLNDKSNTRARLEYALRPLQIIDLLVIAPFYLSFLLPIDLRVLRVFRLLRFFKLLRYSPALHALATVVKNEARALTGALVIMLSLITLGAAGIYFIESAAQPDKFGNMFQAMWWSIATLTTVGYGDVVPITPWGRLFGGIYMIFGIGVFALPIGIIATGFAQESNRRDFLVSWGLVARVPLFKGLDAQAIAEIMTLLYAQTYRPNQTVVREGAPADTMYFISSGEVEIDTNKGTRHLSDGEFFGEMALIEDRDHLHPVRTRSICRLLLLDRDDFIRLCAQHPEISRRVRETARKRAQLIDN